MTLTTYEFKAKDSGDTQRLAEAIGKLCGKGSLIALDGSMGAGKTRFTQSLAKAIGVKGIVNSPTFTIIKEYQGEVLPFYHMDVYRLQEIEVSELGLDEYFYGSGVTVVEWASVIPDLLPEEHLHIEIQDLGNSARFIQVTPRGEPYESWCRQLKENGMIW